MVHVANAEIAVTFLYGYGRPLPLIRPLNQSNQLWMLFLKRQSHILAVVEISTTVRCFIVYFTQNWDDYCLADHNVVLNNHKVGP